MTSNEIDDFGIVSHFSASFPLPFRVLFLAGLGILAWASNLHGLDYMGIDAVKTLGLGSPDAHDEKDRPLLSKAHPGYRIVHTDPSSFYSPIYRIFFTYASWCFASWLVFRMATSGGNLVLVDLFGYIPAVTALLILVALVCPFNVLYKRERDMFLHALRRCIFPSGRVHFSDVVFADIFTSYTKVFRDVWLSFLMFLPGSTLLVTPPSYGWSRWIVPTIMSLPYLIRFRQCLVEYSSDRTGSRKQLWNAVKYATSFPVIFLSAAQKLVEGHLSDSRIEHPFFRMWLFAAAVNALYSFWWDVTCDWGLDLLKPKSKATSRTPPPRPLVLPELHSRSSSLTNGTAISSSESIHDLPPVHGYPWGLRPILLYPLPVYPLLIFLNLILRLTFTIKLSSHLYSNSDGSYVMFWLEMAEIVRRWMWVFIRVEWESIRKASKSRNGTRLHEHPSGEEEDYELVGVSERGGDNNRV